MTFEVGKSRKRGNSKMYPSAAEKDAADGKPPQGLKYSKVEENKIMPELIIVETVQWIDEGFIILICRLLYMFEIFHLKMNFLKRGRRRTMPREAPGRGTRSHQAPSDTLFKSNNHSSRS